MKHPRLLLVLMALVLLLSTSLVTAMPSSPLRTLRIPADQVPDWAHMGITPRHLEDYGAFIWVTLSTDDLVTLDKAGIAYIPIEDAYYLELGGEYFDPLLSQPNIATNGFAPGSSSQKDLRLVQFTGPIQESWLTQLDSLNLQIVQYIHPFTYIVWGTTAELAQAESLPSVRWSGDFLPQYRLLQAYRSLPQGTQPTNVMLYRGADSANLELAIQRLGGVLLTSGVMDDTFVVAQFALPGSILAQVANLAGVYSIQPVPTDGGLRGEMSSQVNVGNYDFSNRAFTGYEDWLAGVGLSGAGVTVADVDSGVDHDHPDLINKMLPCIGTTCAGATQSNHGTHTAGIIAADGASGMVDALGFLRGLGVAPGTKLVEQLYSPTYTYANGMLTLIQQSYSNGATLSSNSWGPSPTPVGYDVNTRQVDVGVRDADSLTPGNQPFTYVLSIMNGYGGVSSQGSPDEAKNVITVGSTKMQTGSGAQYLDINDLSANSAHGPALDGRIIPHLVAPGCNVDSTIINGYSLLCGTSMSSPQVSGAVSLFTEYYRNHFGVDPSPALIKAALLPVAHDLAGYLDADGVLMGHRFDSKQGWGRLDLSAVLIPQGDVLYYDAPNVFDASGQSWSITLNLADVSSESTGDAGMDGCTGAWSGR